MGKKSKTSSLKKPEASLDTELLQKVSDLKIEGNKLFAKKEFARAIEHYEQACKLLPEAAIERADLLCNKAACFLKLRKFKDATRECSSALTLAPSSGKALLRRAQALEQQGLFKQALSDVAALNRGEAASDDTREMEKRLKAVLAGRRSASGTPETQQATTAGAAAAAAAAGISRGNLPSLHMFTANCVLGDDLRAVHMSTNASYAELLAAVRTKFPEAGPLAIRVQDRDGDLITLTCRADLQTALAEAVQAAAASPKAYLQQPSILLQLTPVGSEASIPEPPAEERAEIVARRAAAAKDTAAARARADAAAAAEAGTPAATSPAGGDALEVDPWLLDFAALFKRLSGAGAERPLDDQGEGWEAASRSMELVLRADEALPLFHKAAERFKEVACTGLLNWGNVYLCIAHKLLDGAAEAGTPLADVAGLAAAEFDKAEARYQEALRYKADLFDTLCALGQLEFERAKLKAGLCLKPARPADGASNGGQQQEAEEAAAAAATAALREALEVVTAADVAGAELHIAGARSWFGRAREAAEVLEAGKASEGASKDGAAAAAAKPEGVAQPGLADISLVGQARIMEGNVLYEWSQVLAAVGQEWRPLLDSAVENFRSAGCSEADIRGALRNHLQADSLDLGPEPEPAAPLAPPPAAVEKPAAPEAKGLPSLAPKRKKGDK